MKFDKRHLHHVWRYVKRVKPRYLLIITVVFGVIALVSLRSNNLEMVRLRDAVYTADKNGNGVEESLRALRTHVYNHMNTSLASGPNAVHPPIQLKYTYERLQQQQADVLGQGNSGLYKEAQDYCDARTEIGSEVIACIQTYATSHGANLTPVSDSLYKFDFTSTRWSFDLAGWSIIFTALSFLAFVSSVVVHRWAKHNL